MRLPIIRMQEKWPCSGALLLAAAFALTSCAQTTRENTKAPDRIVAASTISMYSAIQDGETLVPAVDAAKIDPKFLRQVVDYPTAELPGTIVVDPHARFLYLVMENGKAMRYGIGVAKAGLEFQGDARIARKAQWPNWAPTLSMIQREPERYVPLAKGLEGGITNPLGARALYLYKDGNDTLYRIHGTNEPWTIGKSVSSGCIRLFNQDIIDLHSRVPKGSRVVVLNPEQSGQGMI